MNNVEKKIYKLKPGYLVGFEDLLKKYAQFGGGADDAKYIHGRSFSNVYEFYMFAFFIGLHKNIAMDLSDDDSLKGFWEMENWKPKEMVDHLIACALARSDFDMLAVQESDENGVASEIRKLKRTIESYANGGLKYVSTQVESQPTEAEQDDFFIKMLV